MTIQTDLLHEKISNEDYQRLIIKHSESFSDGEIRLLNEILEKFRLMSYRLKLWRKRHAAGTL